MNFWDNFSVNRLMSEASIWSSDLTDLAREFKRVDSYVDLYHFDVSDAHFVPGLLFFPDLIAAGIIGETLKKMNPQYPKPVENIGQYRDQLA